MSRFNGLKATAPPISLGAALVMGLGAAIAGYFATATPAAAQFQIHPQSCADRGDMVDKLKTDYGETLRGAGLQSETGVVELFVAKSGTWTLLVTFPNGVSCPVAVGEHWNEEMEILKGQDQPV